MTRMFTQVLALTLCVGAAAQSAPLPSASGAAEFSADNLYAVGFALKEINPVTAARSELAAKSFRASAALGNANAPVQIGEMYLGGRIPLQADQNALQEAMRYWNLATEKGSAGGLLDLGLLYYNVAIPGVSEETARGAAIHFVPRDVDKAFQYFNAACDKGSGKGCRWTGICYEQGTGVGQSFERAAQSYQRAGRDGTARYLLANLLVTGKGVPVDVPKALASYQAEIDRKGLDAAVSAYAVGQIYEKGVAVKADREKSLAYYQIAAANGNTDAKPAVDQYAAELYREGKALLLAGKYEAALPILAKSAELANPDALKLMGKK